MLLSSTVMIKMFSCLLPESTVTTTHVSGLRKSSTSRFSTTGGRWLCFPFILLIMLIMISADYDHADYDDSGRVDYDDSGYADYDNYGRDHADYDHADYDHADYYHSGSDHADHDVAVAITIIIKTIPKVEKLFSKRIIMIKSSPNVDRDGPRTHFHLYRTWAQS